MTGMRLFPLALFSAAVIATTMTHNAQAQWWNPFVRPDSKKEDGDSHSYAAGPPIRSIEKKDLGMPEQMPGPQLPSPLARAHQGFKRLLGTSQDAPDVKGGRATVGRRAAVASGSPRSSGLSNGSEVEGTNWSAPIGSIHGGVVPASAVGAPAGVAQADRMPTKQSGAQGGRLPPSDMTHADAGRHGANAGDGTSVARPAENGPPKNSAARQVSKANNKASSGSIFRRKQQPKKDPPQSMSGYMSQERQ